MKNQLKSNLDINKTLLYLEKLIEKLKNKIKNKVPINENFHNEIINFLTIVCSCNTNIYKRVNIDFLNIYNPVTLSIMNYAKGKTKKKIISDNSKVFELMDNELKVLNRVKKYLILKLKLES